MVWAGAAAGMVEFENAKRGLASSKKEKLLGVVKSEEFARSGVPERIVPGTAGTCGDALLEESVAGNERNCSSVGRVAVGGGASPA